VTAGADASLHEAEPGHPELQRTQRSGLLPFANFNIHVVPPLTTTAEEAREGLAILDQALTEAR
jgi:hypothetical protein